MQATAFFLIASAACSLASPAAFIRQEPLGKDAPAEFELFSQYAQAAYCAALYDTDVNTEVCVDDTRPVCESFKGTVTVKEFSNKKFGTIAGYVATSSSKKHIVVAFKGTDTNSLVDVQTDLAKNLVPARPLFPGQSCVRCSLHYGFMAAFSSLRADLEQVLKTELGKAGQESYRVVVTGHSLGGAVATIAGAYLRTRGIACDLYTYGSPRVGNQEFADLVTRDGNFSARITNGNDVVPALPYGSLLGLGFYAHVYPEYWYKDGLLGTPKGYETAVTKCSSKEECAGPTCGKAQNFLDVVKARGTCSINDHRKYIDPAVQLCNDVRNSKILFSNEDSITDEQFQKLLEEQEKEEEQKQEYGAQV